MPSNRTTWITARAPSLLAACALVLVAGAACSNGTSADAALDGDIDAALDVITYDVPVPELPPIDVSAEVGIDSSMPDASCSLPATFLPAVPTPFGPTANDPLTVQVSVSGEALAEYGYDFTTQPSPAQTVFVDGWSLQFDRYLLVVDHVRLNQPGADPTMQNVVGPLVAEANGPWVVNLHAHGTISGAGGPPETATPLWLFTGPAAGGGFDPNVRYAFSFETVPATCSVQNVNLVAADLPDFMQMTQNGWTEFFSGTATFMGSPPAAGSVFASYPTQVHFAIGFGAPAAYVNCQNPDLGSLDTDRGVQPSANGRVRAQITFHTDHFFWDETDIEGTPLHFDPIAARVAGFGAGPGAAYNVQLGSLSMDNPAALTDALGATVPDRGVPSLEASMMDLHPPPSYLLRSAAATSGVRDLRDFVTYDARGGGHLNSDGLCFVQPTGPIRY